jgi:hypothetical protein
MELAHKRNVKEPATSDAVSSKRWVYEVLTR